MSLKTVLAAAATAAISSLETKIAGFAVNLVQDEGALLVSAFNDLKAYIPAEVTEVEDQYAEFVAAGQTKKAAVMGAVKYALKDVSEETTAAVTELVSNAVDVAVSAAKAAFSSASTTTDAANTETEQ